MSEPTQQNIQKANEPTTAGPPGSLRTFHVIFVGAAMLLCAGFGIYELVEFAGTGGWATLLVGVGALVVGILLAVYGKWFLDKMRRLHVA